jgi:hypothetical protein
VRPCHQYARKIERVQAHQGCDASTVKQAENNSCQIDAVVLSCDMVKCNQGGPELELVCALVARDPMGCKAQI